MQRFSNQTQQACETTKMVELLRGDLEALVDALILRSSGQPAGTRSWYAWPTRTVTGSPEVPTKIMMLALFT